MCQCNLNSNLVFSIARPSPSYDNLIDLLLCKIFSILHHVNIKIDLPMFSASCLGLGVKPIVLILGLGIGPQITHSWVHLQDACDYSSCNSIIFIFTIMTSVQI